MSKAVQLSSNLNRGGKGKNSDQAVSQESELLSEAKATGGSKLVPRGFAPPHPQVCRQVAAFGEMLQGKKSPSHIGPA